jgi:hypothetical protein
MAKRTVKGQQYNPEQLVSDALAAVAINGTDTESARLALVRLGHAEPEDALIARYAFQVAVLDQIGQAVGEPDALRRQVGKWDMGSTESIVRNLNAYLDRRNAGRRARWTQSHR